MSGESVKVYVVDSVFVLTVFLGSAGKQDRKRYIENGSLQVVQYNITTYYSFILTLLSFYFTLHLHCYNKLPFINLQTPTYYPALLATTTQPNSSAEVISPHNQFKYMYIIIFVQ